MDPKKNPYSPGAGAPPPELVGRNPILEQAEILLGRIQTRRPEKSLLLTGLRGVGKTVLLSEIQNRAEKEGYHTIFIEACENKPLGALLIPHLRTLLYKMDRMANVGNKVKRALSVLRSFIGAVKLSYEKISIELGIEPELGTADSGNLEFDLPQLFTVIGETAIDQKSSIAIFIDEIQYLSKEELGALIMAMHKLQQKQLPMLLIGAGLPTLPGLAGESKSYSERLFHFPDVGALSQEDTIRALKGPAEAMHISFTNDALERIYQLTKGFPYFVQEWGYSAWNEAESNPITLESVNQAIPKVIQKLDNSFFRVRFDRLTPKEKDFLRRVAELGPGPHKIGDITSKFNMESSQISPIRANLMKKGMIFSPSYGYVDFTVPLFEEFMVRAMPLPDFEEEP